MLSWIFFSEKKDTTLENLADTTVLIQFSNPLYSLATKFIFSNPWKSQKYSALQTYLDLFSSVFMIKSSLTRLGET